MFAHSSFSSSFSPLLVVIHFVAVGGFGGAFNVNVVAVVAAALLRLLLLLLLNAALNSTSPDIILG